MIELPDLGDADGAMWTALLDIAERTHDWTLIGGQMVLLHGLEHARLPPRISEDLDVVVNVRAQPPALPRMMTALRDLGFVLSGISPDGIAHRFERAGVLVDVLAPDGLGGRTSLRTIGGATIPVAGGTYALAESHLVPVAHRGRSGRISRPSIAGALVVKAGAATTDRGLHGPERHLRDLAFLCTLVDDAFALRGHLGVANQRRLRAVRPLADETHPAWSIQGSRRDDAYATWMALSDVR